METPQINIIEDDEGTLKCTSIRHPQYLTARLNTLRSEDVMTDIKLNVKDKLFSCHRLILIALSFYFEGMFRGRNFSESSANTIELEGLTPAAVDSLINYMYTGTITISECIVSDVLTAANMWQMKDVVEICQMFQKRLLERKPERAISILLQSILFDFKDLIFRSLEVVCEHFDIAIKQPEFIKLSYKEITFILSNEQLSAPKESILNAVTKWFECNQETDLADIYSLLSFIPLNLVNLECLRETYSNELWQRFPSCAQIFKNTIDTVEQNLALKELLAGRNVERNEIYVFDTFSNRRSLFKFNIQSGHSDRIADVPYHYMCCGFIKNKIFAIGAWNSCNLCKYDLQLNTWSLCRPLPSKRRLPAVGVLNETIYVCGGCDVDNGRHLNSVVNYNPETDEWSSVAEMQQQRTIACATELNGFLYVIGGYDGRNTLSSCERYSILTNRWESISPLPSPRCRAAVISVNNSLYVLGGYDRSPGVSSVFRYDLSSGSWSSCAEMPFSASLPSACAVRGKIFVSGGFGNDRLKKSAVFNIHLNSWTEGPDLPHPTALHSSFPII